MTVIRKIRTMLGDLWWIERNIRLRIRWSRACRKRVPLIGGLLAAWIDRSMLKTYGLDVDSGAIDIMSLSIAHPVGVLLGGVGIYSPGRVVIMAGVKFGGVSPKNAAFLAKHKERRTFELGDNVVIATGATLIGPLSICDNVVIAPQSLVNKSITEPGIYIGNPARRISDKVNFDWVAHLPVPAGKEQ